MKIANGVGRSDFLCTVDEDLRKNVRHGMICIIKGWVWGKEEEMLTAERPFSRQGAPASSKGWCNLNCKSDAPRFIFYASALLLHRAKIQEA